MKLCGFEVGLQRPLFLIAGPCVIEGREFSLETAGRLKEITARLGIPFIYKSSFDKANRSSIGSFRGPGMEEGLKILESVREQIGVPVLTDIHEDTPLGEVAAVVDVLQTPAFLCRQTNFIVAACSQGKPVNIKKGQFLSPWEMKNVIDKARSTGNAPPPTSTTIPPRKAASTGQRLSSSATKMPTTTASARIASKPMRAFPVKAACEN